MLSDVVRPIIGEWFTGTDAVWTGIAGGGGRSEIAQTRSDNATLSDTTTQINSIKSGFEALGHSDKSPYKLKPDGPNQVKLNFKNQAMEP
ncbi:unnamed protein product, partial [Iphiclides podalirius]